MKARGAHIRAFVIADYTAARALWEGTEGLGLNESDTETAIGIFLDRNPGMSAVAVTATGDLVGAVLAGHDGRRGYLHHLAVARALREQGIARALLDHCYACFRRAQISRCNIFMYRDNERGAAFWKREGFALQSWLVLQKRLDG